MKDSLSQILYPSVVSADWAHISFSGVSVERRVLSILFFVITILHRVDDDYYDY